jgi:hypothetical protein
VGSFYVNPAAAIFTVSTYSDQVGVGDVPANAPNFILHGGPWGPRGAATVYVLQSTKNQNGIHVFNDLTQANRNYDGTDNIRLWSGGIRLTSHVNNNDSSWAGGNNIGGGIISEMITGSAGPSYGTSHCLSLMHDVRNCGSSGNEPTLIFGTIVGGDYNTTGAALAAHYWYVDGACQWPIGIQCQKMVGLSLVCNNRYNGNPSYGPSAAFSALSGDTIGGRHEYFTANLDGTGASATTYPVGIGFHAGGWSTGGTGDSFTNAFQAGGSNCSWGNVEIPQWGSDQGQIGRGFVVYAKNAGTSCARLGAFVSQGTGEAGGLIFGADTSDANRSSVYRPANGVLALSGKLNVVSEAASSVATPANVTGKIPIYDATGTLVGYIPVYGTL